MQESGFTHDKPYRKSARIVGEVMGKYHPHGDAAIYDAMVRMAQPFSLRVPLIDGQGNFGSIDGDPPAAMRYTESRLSRAAMHMLADIDKDTVDFQPELRRAGRGAEGPPRRVPEPAGQWRQRHRGRHGDQHPDPQCRRGDRRDARADRQPGHHPRRADADRPRAGFPDRRHHPRPVRHPPAFETGRGGIPLRAKAAIEEIRKDRNAIVVSEIPYQVNKNTLIERIAELVRAKQVEGISDLRDESDRDGMRIVIELKRDATPEVVLNHLYRFTQLQTQFSVNMLALDSGRPRLMGLKDALAIFIAFREEVILRRSRFELNKARERAHLLVGLAIAVANIDEVIRVIRASPDSAVARTELMARAWPAGDIGGMLALIDDSGNVVGEATPST